VTGAGGFIGGAVCRRLAALGHDVVGHVSSRDGALAYGSIPPGIEAIVNSAGKLGRTEVSERELTTSNALLPERLARFCAAARIPLVHISTPGVVGLRVDATEALPPAPWGPYERSKAEGESLVRKHLDLPGGLLTILRPDFVYGPGDTHKLELFRQAARGCMPLIGHSGARLRPTFVDDVCAAVTESLPGGCLNGDLYHVGGPGTATLRELTQCIATSLGRRLLPLPLPRPVYLLALRLGPLCPRSITPGRLQLLGSDHWVSIRKAAAAGFEPVVGLEEGVRATVEWYRTEGLLR